MSGGRRLGGVRGPLAAPARASTRSGSPARLRRAGRAHPGRRQPVARRRIVPFSTLHYREDPDYWAQWFPADFITESFPGQFRNWFYSHARDVHGAPARAAVQDDLRLRHCVFGEDGRPMHKSWGNAIEFDEAAERMGVDVMRWMFAKRAARGQHPLRLARGRRGAARAAGALERLRVLRHLRRASPAGRRPRPTRPAVRAGRRASTAGSCRARRGSQPTSRPGCATTTPRRRARSRRLRRRSLDVVPAPVTGPHAPRRCRHCGRRRG